MWKNVKEGFGMTIGAILAGALWMTIADLVLKKPKPENKEEAEKTEVETED